MIVLITAIGSFSSSDVLRACKERGIYIVGTDIYPKTWLSEGGNVDAFYQVPRFDAGDAYLFALKEIIEREKVDAILPLTDAEIDILNEHRSELGAKLLLSDQEVIKVARDKEKTKEVVDRVIVGETQFLTIPTHSFSGDEELPLIVKPKNGRSSQGLYRIKTEKERQWLVENILDRENMIAQPMMDGDVVTVDVVVGKDGCAAALPRKELLRTYNGAGLSVKVFRDRNLEKVSISIAKALGVLGCVNMEWIVDRENTYHFLECNPRFSGGIAFSNKAGFDMSGAHLSVFLDNQAIPDNQAKPCSLVKKYIEVCTEGENNECDG